MQTAHTIVLRQSTRSEASRTFSDHPSVQDAIEGICCMFERELKERNPDRHELTYDVKELHAFIDDVADISALVYDNKLKAYVPCGREWIKKHCFQHLHRAVTRSKR